MEENSENFVTLSTWQVDSTSIVISDKSLVLGRWSLANPFLPTFAWLKTDDR